MLRTKINVNLGVSRDWKDYDIEMQKVMAAVDMGSGRNHGSVFPWRYYRIPEKTDFGMSGDDWNCTGIYDSVIHYQRDLATLTAKRFY